MRRQNTEYRKDRYRWRSGIGDTTNSRLAKKLELIWLGVSGFKPVAEIVLLKALALNILTVVFSVRRLALAVSK
jgi:hypothetical protein